MASSTGLPFCPNLIPSITIEALGDSTILGLNGKTQMGPLRYSYVFSVFVFL
jgi:hypothetical protein